MTPTRAKMDGQTLVLPKRTLGQSDPIVPKKRWPIASCLTQGFDVVVYRNIKRNLFWVESPVAQRVTTSRPEIGNMWADAVREGKVSFE